MSSPIEKKKAELKEMMNFDEGAVYRAACDAKGIHVKCFAAGARHEHAKAAPIAEQLLECIWALEAIVKGETDRGLKMGGYQFHQIAERTLAKLSKGSEKS